MWQSMIGISTAAIAGVIARAAVPARKPRRSMEGGGDGQKVMSDVGLKCRMAWKLLAASWSVNAIGDPRLSDTESALRHAGIVDMERLRPRTIQSTFLHFQERRFQAAHKLVHIEQSRPPS